jgi:hypothetical protein
MDWETEEFGSNINEPPKSKRIHTPKNNLKAYAEAIPDGKISTTNPLTGKKTELNPDMERKVLSYFKPEEIRMTPVTNTPKTLSAYTNFKGKLPREVKRRELMKQYRADYAAEVEQRRIREEENAERYRLFQEEMGRRRYENREYGSNNNSVGSYNRNNPNRYNSNLNGGKRNKKSRKTIKNRKRNNKTRRNN